MLNSFNNFLKLFDGTDHQVSRLKDIISVTPFPLLLCSSQSSETKNLLSLDFVSLLIMIDLLSVAAQIPLRVSAKKNQKTKPKQHQNQPTQTPQAQKIIPEQKSQ